MKNLLKITDAKIIITLFALSITAFITIAVYKSSPIPQQTTRFVGVDANGYTHYPNGAIEYNTGL